MRNSATKPQQQQHFARSSSLNRSKAVASSSSSDKNATDPVRKTRETNTGHNYSNNTGSLNDEKKRGGGKEETIFRRSRQRKNKEEEEELNCHEKQKPKRKRFITVLTIGGNPDSAALLRREKSAGELRLPPPSSAGVSRSSSLNSTRAVVGRDNASNRIRTDGNLPPRVNKRRCQPSVKSSNSNQSEFLFHDSHARQILQVKKAGGLSHCVSGSDNVTTNSVCVAKSKKATGAQIELKKDQGCQASQTEVRI